MKKRFLIFLCFLLIAIAVPLPAFAAGDGIYDIALDSRGVFFCNLETDTVLYDKDSNLPCAPAALTEIVTALCVLDACPDPKNTFVTVEDLTLFDRIVMEGAYHMQLARGETFSVFDLLAAMMLGGRCDAAELLAYRFGNGSVSSFVGKMNEKCAALRMQNSHFENPHGVFSDPLHVSTPADLAKALEAAIDVPLFYELFSLTSYVIPKTERRGEREYKTSVSLFDPESDSFVEGMIGAKSGFNDDAGRCMASLARRGGLTYLCVLTGANLDPDAHYPHNMTLSETGALYGYAFEHYEQKTLYEAGGEAARLPVIDSDFTVPVVVPGAVTALVRTDSEPEFTLDLPSEIAAENVKDGERVGSLTVTFGGREVRRVSLFLRYDGSEIHVQGALEKKWRAFAAFVKGLFSSDKVFVTLLILLLVLIGVCIPAVKITQILHKRSSKPPKH